MFHFHVIYPEWKYEIQGISHDFIVQNETQNFDYSQSRPESPTAETPVYQPTSSQLIHAVSEDAPTNNSVSPQVTTISSETIYKWRHTQTSRQDAFSSCQ